MDQPRVIGREVLDVGSFDGNGSLRQMIERLGPRRYVGIDMQPGPGVDIVGRAEELTDRFGHESFDVVVSTELLEHVRDWRRVVREMKAVLRPGGLLVLTTRSIGYPFHGAPHDYWRYEPEDISTIFADFVLERSERDPTAPGVFVAAHKPGDWTAIGLDDVALYSMVCEERVQGITTRDLVASFVRHPRRLLNWLPEPLKRPLRFIRQVISSATRRNSNAGA